MATLCAIQEKLKREGHPDPITAGWKIFWNQKLDEPKEKISLEKVLAELIKNGFTIDDIENACKGFRKKTE